LRSDCWRHKQWCQTQVDVVIVVVGVQVYDVEIAEDMVGELVAQSLQLIVDEGHRKTKSVVDLELELDCAQTAPSAGNNLDLVSVEPANLGAHVKVLDQKGEVGIDVKALNVGNHHLLSSDCVVDVELHFEVTIDIQLLFSF